MEFQQCGRKFRGNHPAFSSPIRIDVQEEVGGDAAERVSEPQDTVKKYRKFKTQNWSAANYTPNTQKTKSKILNSAGFCYSAEDLKIWSGIQLSTFVIKGYTDMRVKKGDRQTSLESFNTFCLDDKSGSADFVFASNGPVSCLQWCPHYVSSNNSKILACHSPSDSVCKLL
jgi:hypothetical protein